MSDKLNQMKLNEDCERCDLCHLLKQPSGGHKHMCMKNGAFLYDIHADNKPCGMERGRFFEAVIVDRPKFELPTIKMDTAALVKIQESIENHVREIAETGWDDTMHLNSSLAEDMMMAAYGNDIFKAISAHHKKVSIR